MEKEKKFAFLEAAENIYNLIKTFLPAFNSLPFPTQGLPC